MELTAQALREVEFREKLRGYHPDDVDDFLEEVAVAVDALLRRLRDAERGAPARRPAVPDEEPVAPAERSTVSEETLRRTLLLAQRTADAAVIEAEETARRIVAEAHEQARRLVADAEARAASMTDEAHGRAETEIGDLQEQRAGLQREVAALRNWAAQQRDRLSDALEDQIRALDVWLASTSPPGSRARAAAADRPPAPERRPSRPPAPGGDDAPGHGAGGDEGGPGRTAPPRAPSAARTRGTPAAARRREEARPTRGGDPARGGGEPDPPAATQLGARMFRRR